MRKSTLTLIAAGLLAAGGMAQAQTYVWTDTTVLGAAPATVVVPMDRYVYVQPGYHSGYRQRHQAAATFNVPARAGEASTMTGGAPNVSTDNQRLASSRYVDVYSYPSMPYSAPGAVYYGS